jgi:hypothetical protein
MDSGRLADAISASRYERIKHPLCKYLDSLGPVSNWREREELPQAIQHFLE